jgi:glycosyltransferase involved in cell wall biosynthesis
MKFSIIIPTYNRLPLLKRAINSALAQTIPSEVIVVDNGSSEETAFYLDNLGEKIVVCRQQKNLGHSVAMNVGVEIARGDWIKPIDDDDYLAPNCLAEMKQAIERHPPAVICSCQAIIERPNWVQKQRIKQAGPRKSFYIPQADIHYGMLLEQVRFGTPIQVAFRRDAFLLSGGWNSQLEFCCDIDSWLKIAQFGDAIFLNQYLAYRTIWPGGSHLKFSLQEQLNVSLFIKEKLYTLVDKQHRSYLPSQSQLHNYLKLYWSLVACKQGKILTSFRMAWPAVLSLPAWQLLFAAILTRLGNFQANLKIRKQALIE